MLTSKWHTLNANCQKFNAAYKRAKRLGKSGENDVDLMKRAQSIYREEHKGVSFCQEDAWAILKFHPKWDAPEQVDLIGDVLGATQEDLFGYDARPRSACKPRPAKKTKSDTTASTGRSSASTQFGVLMEQELRLKRKAAERAFEAQVEKDRTLMRLDELRSTVPDPALLTTAITTTVVASTSVLLPKGVSEPTHGSIFADSTSADTANVCCSLFDQLAPLMFFSQLCAIEYDQLFTEFNVGAARQTCLGAEVRMRFEHVLKGKKRLEAEAAEAIRLRSRISDIKGTDATRTSELESLKERNAALEFAVGAKDYEIAKLSQDLSSLQLSCDNLSIKASTPECEKDKRVDQ
nr:glutathione S-transferase T3-like [Tanacetum cinerariifolium]